MPGNACDFYYFLFILLHLEVNLLTRLYPTHCNLLLSIKTEQAKAGCLVLFPLLSLRLSLKRDQWVEDITVQSNSVLVHFSP